MKSRYHIRSVSLPSKSNPIISRIGEELNKLKAWEDVDEYRSSWSTSASTVENITLRLSGLVELYKCIDDALISIGSSTSNSMIKYTTKTTSSKLEVVEKQKKKQQQQEVDDVEQLLEGSLRLLDLSSSARDMVVQLKDSIRDLQSSLRRRIKGDHGLIRGVNVEDIIMASTYLSSRKEIIKVAKRGISELKRMDYSLDDYVNVNVDDQVRRSSSSTRTSTVINSLRFASTVNVSVYKSLLSFLATPVAVRRWSTSKWSVVSNKYFENKKGTTTTSTSNYNYNEDHQMNELMIIIKSVEVALSSLCCSSSSGCLELEAGREGSKGCSCRVGAVQSELDELEMGLEGIEGGLEGLFRQLIKTRVSLLNIIGSI